MFQGFYDSKELYFPNYGLKFSLLSSSTLLLKAPYLQHDESCHAAFINLCIQNSLSKLRKDS